ncbi:hypothetical protein EVAR_49324_1 [Eumeta japonica]|uniref:Uncharacterized protein n=1 Tax=Eumeta variegata TaxID=151549 RepID=A0A4C1Y7B2_EUMVA|nr:hypothetical protein EVAR_49324_1 [Eumeta japonica]
MNTSNFVRSVRSHHTTAENSSTSSKARLPRILSRFIQIGTRPVALTKLRGGEEQNRQPRSRLKLRDGSGLEAIVRLESKLGAASRTGMRVGRRLRLTRRPINMKNEGMHTRAKPRANN